MTVFLLIKERHH